MFLLAVCIMGAGAAVSVNAAVPSLSSAFNNAEFSGYIGTQLRWFYENPLDTRQEDVAFSFNIEPEWYTEWHNGDDSFTFTPYLRLDASDSERSHFDVREFYWQHFAKSWELGVGISKVYWGVTESQHLVDIVNQTDFVEAPDGEEKLGQPMLRFSTVQNWGIVDVFVLPGFRERTFPGKDGRLRGELSIDTDAVRYESAAEERHVDFAVRWSHSFSVIDLGVSNFFGTSRDPLLIPTPNTATPIKLVPFYEQIQQWGIDAQAITGSWLWKLESIYRESDFDEYVATTSGFEYTFVGIFEQVWDLGVLVEYSHDSRSSNNAGVLQNDIFVGGRFAFNDVDSSEILFGLIQDTEYSSSLSGLIEVNTRLGEQVKLYIEAQFFNSDEIKDPTFQLRQDSYIEASAEYYF